MQSSATGHAILRERQGTVGTEGSERGEGSADRKQRQRHVYAKRPRVCVVDSRPQEPWHAQLDEHDFDVMAVLPRINDVNLAMLGNVDLVVVACNELLLMDPPFVRWLSELVGHTRVLGVASKPTPELAAYAARIGFHGFVAREVEADAFRRSVAAVLSGEFAFPRIAMSALVRFIRSAYRYRPKGGQAGSLTPRQLQIVDLMARGANDQEIAKELNISASTVHKHVQNALRRTKTKTRSHLAAALGQPT